MLPIAQRYLDNWGGEPELAMRQFAEDLMRDDPADFKAGYSRANAIIATAEAFGTDRESVDELLPHEGHFSTLGGTWWCDTCNSPYCERA